jgi:folate-binding protein YgfZ
MNEISQCQLTHLDAILLAGPDAIKFLQGQCTQDVNSLKTGEAVHGAFCNAKGRAITNVYITRVESETPTLALICHESSAAPLAKHLSKYVAFFRGTKLTHEKGRYKGYGLTNSAEHPEFNLAEITTEGGFSFNYGQQSAQIWIDTNSNQTETNARLASFSEIPSEQWKSHEITHKQLWLTEQEIERWIPQNFSLDDLEGISFTKGCYTGQEVIARLHYKGKSKKRLFAVSWASSENTSQIYGESGVVGDVIESVVWQGATYALAIIKSDKTESALYADENQQVEIQLLH